MAGTVSFGKFGHADRSCPFGICDGSGWILGPEDVARPCECRERQAARRRARGVAGAIPRKFRDVSFESLANDGIDATKLGMVREFVDDLESRLERGRGLWFSGEPGTFKTALAMLVSKSALERGHSAAIYFLPKLLAEIRATYESSPGQDSYLTFFERVTSVDLLHIDDLGVEKRTDWVLEQLYAIVNERYEGERSLVVTTNLTDSQLEEQLGSRIVSRIVEMCGDPITLEGEDRRYLRAVGSG